MAFGNEILFGRIAVYNGLVTVGQFEDCLKLQRERAPSMHIGQIMIERGLIDEVQARAVLTAQRRRLHKGLRPEKAANELDLTRRLVEEGLVDRATVTLARKVKDEMEERGLFPALGDILVQQGSVTLSMLGQVQTKINVTDLWCVSCGKKYRASNYRPGIDARCRKCGGRIEPRGEQQAAHAPVPEPEPEPPGAGAITTEGPPPAEPTPPAEPADSFEFQLPNAVRTRRPTAAIREPSTGDVVGGCRLEEKIGEGGWGYVFRARQLTLDREVAVKVLIPSRLGSGNVIQRFLAEARAAARLTHPNIVDGHEVGEDGGIYFLNMRFIEGQPLGRLLASGGRLPVRDALLIARQAADALDYAHKNMIVHRDVKPGNIMLDAEKRATLVDFGLTKTIGGDANLTSADIVVGTVFYVSPEQAEGRPVDGRTDLYSLGITLFEMLTGRVPFSDRSLWKVLRCHQKEPPPDPTMMRPDLPEAVSKLVLRLLRKSPDERPATGAKLVEEIDRLIVRT